MVKRLLGLALAVGALVTAMSPAVASAAGPPYGPPAHASGPPVGGCPNGAGWESVEPSGPEHLSAAYDFNGDGFVCGYVLPAFDGDTLFSLKDNVSR